MSQAAQDRAADADSDADQNEPRGARDRLDEHEPAGQPENQGNQRPDQAGRQKSVSRRVKATPPRLRPGG
jgi:hypothetical protein